MSPRSLLHRNSSHSSPAMPPLTPIQLQVLKLLLEGNTVTAAAAQSEIHRTTIHHWCRTKPEFVHALDAARCNRQAILHDEMDRLAASAVTVLEQTLADDSAPQALRVNAALAVIRGVNQVSSRKPLLPRTVAENIEMENFLRSLESELNCTGTLDTMVRESRAAASSTACSTEDAQSSRVAAPPPAQSRNSRCPCGSGVKYKRCCGTAAAAKAAP